MAKQSKPRGLKVSPVSAWIVTAGRADRECRVLDISLAGAKVVVEVSAGIPDSFELAFFRSANLRRVCEVVWRTGKVLGVKFVT
jgi:hypothetical protein